MTTAELHLSLDQRKNRVVVDGVDITRNVNRIDVHAEPGQLPRLEIGLRIYEITALGDEHTVLRIDQGTVDLLKRCGWTAPQGDPTVLRVIPTAAIGEEA